MKYHALCLCLALMLAGCSHPAEKAAVELLSRVTGGRQAEFKVLISPERKEGKDWFAYYPAKGKIVLEGNNGVSVASALGHYLKTYCGWHLSWCGSQETLPEVLPLPTERCERKSPYKYRYYLNYCTFNYSMSWWDFGRWQKEIDFMALNGINMPLALTGQNSVWQRVYRRLGFTDEELESFFSGPAYFNWFWMGNLDGWGGPLPQSFMGGHEKLQKKILRAERRLGMTPVLSAFTGHVPPAFENRFPDARVRKTSWVNFPEVSILDPDEDLFTTIGKMFIEEQTRLYGTDHFYSADTFNENRPPTNDPDYLGKISSKVYRAMKDADPEAVWVMQGWLFYHAHDFWGEDEIRALLGAVPDEGMLILDLWSERYPVWKHTAAYYGKPWIWCMLHNFGQNITMSGNMGNIASGPATALKDSTSGNLSGIGLTMEGIGQSPMVYAMMLENVWRDAPIDKDAFLSDYLTRRYGSFNETAYNAWQILMGSVYENTVNNGGHESIITGRPTFKKNPGGTTNTRPHYNRGDLVRAWQGLVSSSAALSGSDGFRYDLVDVTRQVLADYASILQQKAAGHYKAGDPEGFMAAAGAFLALMDDMEALLGTRQEFLLGPWLSSARKWGHHTQEKNLYEQNARNLITLWGDRDCRIRDYACRQWNGMISGFYKPRWERFFDFVTTALVQGKAYDEKSFEDSCKDWEWEWTFGHEEYMQHPCGSELEECLRIWEKYNDDIEKAYV